MDLSRRDFIRSVAAGFVAAKFVPWGKAEAEKWFTYPLGDEAYLHVQPDRKILDLVVRSGKARTGQVFYSDLKELWKDQVELMRVADFPVMAITPESFETQHGWILTDESFRYLERASFLNGDERWLSMIELRAAPAEGASIIDITHGGGRRLQTLKHGDDSVRLTGSEKVIEFIDSTRGIPYMDTRDLGIKDVRDSMFPIRYPALYVNPLTGLSDNPHVSTAQRLAELAR